MPNSNTRSTNTPSLTKRKAREFAFKSKVTGPIHELSLLRRSLLFAEVSMISYLPIEECNIAAGKLGFVDGKFFNSNNAQAYWFQSKHDSVVVCRGTEAQEWEDIKADANAVAAVAETVGKVHRGFKSEVDEIWPYLEKELEVNKKPLWFCGHSLGAAMATICAGRCMLSYIKSEPEELYTYGSPRIGCRRYVNHVPLTHYRWVNNNDIVTRVPPVWLGYRHGGKEMYMDSYGRLREVTGWRRVSDRLQGLLREIRRFRIDYLSDHSAIQYIDRIFQIARKEKQAKPDSDVSAVIDHQDAEPNQSASTTSATSHPKDGAIKTPHMVSQTETAKSTETV